MRLWSVQSRAFLETAAAGPLVADWDCTPENFRFAYRWMADQWNARNANGRMEVPIWCWHSCNGAMGSPPTIGTVSALIGDWNYYAPSMVVAELAVPDRITLLSSYHLWNEALGDGLESRSERIRTATFVDMFDEPLLKHEDDDIQAVIPCIERSWIVDVRELPSDDSDWEMPFRRFPKMGKRDNR